MRLKINEGPNRIYPIDELRGLAILGMVALHGLYYYEMIFGERLLFLSHPFVRFLAIAGGGLFIFISGISCSFSRSNLKRGLQVLGLGILISLVTYGLWKGFDQRNTFIFFGILHLLGSSMILFGILEKPLKKARPLLWAALLSGLFALSWMMVYKGLFREEVLGLEPVRALYDMNLLYLAGYPNWRFFPPVDFYPLLPWTLLFFVGGFLGAWVVRRRLPQPFYRPHARFLVFCGQHTLAIYLIHPLVLYPLVLLFYALFGA